MSGMPSADELRGEHHRTHEQLRTGGRTRHARRHAGTDDTRPDPEVVAAPTPAPSTRLRESLQRTLARFPFRVTILDPWDRSYSAGGAGGDRHWCTEPTHIHVKTRGAADQIRGLNGMGFLESFVRGEVDIEGNLYALSYLKRYASIGRVRLLHMLPGILRQRAFQTVGRSRVNVKSHYDIPQEALDLYLDTVYRSYSCGMWQDPQRVVTDELIRPGGGPRDGFDSLERSMWTKFADAADFIEPREGETLFDVGCGYGGQLAVALERHPFARVVGWTHSRNQREVGARMLSGLDPSRWEINEGDYRQETRVFDHVTSTGMVCHVGPRGLVPYVRRVRRHIRRGGRYLHHVIMSTYNRMPLDLQVGPAFNKKYVWPGFHWFTFGTHVRALERNGFQVVRASNLSPHYAKTTAAWYERMMAHRQAMAGLVGEQTLRAWRVFLAGISGGFSAGSTTVYRIYCRAV